jgi:hypothetical protein
VAAKPHLARPAAHAAASSAGQLLTMEACFLPVEMSCAPVRVAMSTCRRSTRNHC